MLFYFSGTRNMPQQLYTSSPRAHPNVFTINPTEGTKSLTSSPLLVTRNRRNGGPLYGSTSYSRDRFYNSYSSQHEEANLGHTDINPSAQATSSLVIPASTFRSLSGPQQQVVYWVLNSYNRYRVPSTIQITTTFNRKWTYYWFELEIF